MRQVLFLMSIVLFSMIMVSSLVFGDMKTLNDLPDWIRQQRTPTMQSISSKRLGCVSTSKKDYEKSLDCLESFITEQLDAFTLNDKQLPQSYRVGWDYSPPRPGYPYYYGYLLSRRADISDASVAAIFLINRERLNQAKRILDAIKYLVDHDYKGDGRIRSAYEASDLYGLKAANFFANAVDKNVRTGDAALAIIALGRFYHVSQDFTYLKAALKIANFIETECKGEPIRSGYTGGFVWNSQEKTEKPSYYRSTEENLLVLSAAKLLYSLTGDKRWNDMASSASKFVRQMWDNNEQAYLIGTADSRNDITINTENIPTKAQTFNILSDSETGVERYLSVSKWIMTKNYVEDTVQDASGNQIKFEGITYGKGGQGLESQTTASTAMALWALSKRSKSSDQTRFKSQAKALLQSLKRIQSSGPNSDANGIVSSVNTEGALAWQGDEYAGQTWRFFPLLNVGSTAWTGLAIQFIDQDNEYANIFSSSFHEKETGRTTPVSAEMRLDPIGQYDNQNLNIIAIVAIGLSLFAITILFGYLSYRGVSRYLGSKRVAKSQFVDSDLELKVHRKISLPKRLEGLMMTPTPNTPTPGSPVV